MLRLSLGLTALLTLAGVGLATPARLAAAPAAPAAASVTITGDLQNELGCSGDYDPSCAATHLTYDAVDDVWQGSWSVPAGAWTYYAALNDSWNEYYGLHAASGSNANGIPLNLGAGTTVKFYYDDKSHWATDSQSAVIATVPGSFQSELGCPGDWQPDCLRSWLQDPDGNGLYRYTTTLIPRGAYNARVAINESWDESYGQGGSAAGADFGFTVPADGAPVSFVYNAASHVLTIVANRLFLPLVRR